MSHSVKRHLGIEIREYDETIRRFIPGYEAMLRIAAVEVSRSNPELVLDLGAGTGALSEAILMAVDSGTVVLIDVDRAMLLHARTRLEAFADRVRFTESSFHAPLPRCDSVAASLALHHVRTIDAKHSLYRRIHGALEEGGVFVNADAAMPAEPGARESTYGEWVDHMVAQGIAEQEAISHLEKWSEEDTYFSLDEELAAVSAAGFEAECVWRLGPMAVVVGRKQD